MKIPPAALLSLLVLAACEAPPVPEPEPAPPAAGYAQPRPRDQRDLKALQRALLDAEQPFYLAYVTTFGSRVPAAILCDAPLVQGEEGVGLKGPGSYSISDAIGMDEPDGIPEMSRRARARNLAIVDRRDFPYPDVCRPRRPGERPLMLRSGDPDADAMRGSAPARPVAGPPRSLHDAARRGTPDQIRAWARRGSPLDTPDAFSRTPLAWAVVRGRPEATQALLDLGADPDAALPYQKSARWIAARAGRADLFEMMARRDTARYAPASDLVEAAVAGGSAPIVRRLLDDRGETLRFEELMPPSVRQGDPAVRELLLRTGGVRAANGLLRAAVDQGDLPAFEQALARGANPNAVDHCDAPLQLAADGGTPHSDLMVRRLLEEGADVDAGVEYDPRLAKPCLTPLTLLLTRVWRDPDDSVRLARARQDRILPALLRARPDMKALGEDGRPLVVLAVAGRFVSADAWVAGRRSTLEPMLSDDWMRALIDAGMDVNARWQGRTALDWAVEAYGPVSTTARRLRRYGARRS